MVGKIGINELEEQNASIWDQNTGMSFKGMETSRKRCRQRVHKEPVLQTMGGVPAGCRVPQVTMPSAPPGSPGEHTGSWSCGCRAALAGSASLAGLDAAAAWLFWAQRHCLFWPFPAAVVAVRMVGGSLWQCYRLW